MLFYFSGTGNSKFVAETLVGSEEKLYSIPELMMREPLQFSFSLKKGESVGFVFPVHAWGPPQMVIDFIQMMQREDKESPYCYAVCTCAEDTGKTMDLLRQALGFKGMPLHAVFSVQMPNNYSIASPVYGPVKVQELMAQADERLALIKSSVDNKELPISDCHEGKMAKFRTKVIHPQFTKHGIRPKLFYVKDQCTSCSACEKICMTENIEMADTDLGLRPKWGKNCTLCLGCINTCPVEAIQYGKKSEDTGRYFFHR